MNRELEPPWFQGCFGQPSRFGSSPPFPIVPRSPMAPPWRQSASEIGRQMEVSVIHQAFQRSFYIYSTSILGRIFIHIKPPVMSFFWSIGNTPNLSWRILVIKRGLIVLGQQHGNTSGSLVLSGVGCHLHPKNSFRSWVLSRFLLT